jgi:alkylation response protein AidB-like acyl-CoA dehydrogenase
MMNPLAGTAPEPDTAGTAGATPRLALAGSDETANHDAAFDALAEALAVTAVERDRVGGHAAAERERIRASGLLKLSIPREHGGLGADWACVLRGVRRIAQADSALAHVFAFHHLQMASVLLFGSAQQQQRYFRATVQQQQFWGNALNPLDRRAIATPRAGGGYGVDGLKSFSSGSVGSDMLLISAWHEASGSALVAAIPTARAGVTVYPDWDAFGQKQTDSGRVAFAGVELAPDEILQPPGALPSVRASLRTLISQMILSNLYLGIAIGAFAAARRFVTEEARPWFAAGVPTAADDPFTQQRFGNGRLLIRPAELLADDAATRLDAALRRGAALTAEERGGLALAVAEARVLAHRAALEVSAQMFESLGARATSARYGFDRFWRNARVHTLHDPVDYKIRDIGRFQLLGTLPEPSPYS